MSDPDAFQDEMRRLLLGEFGADPAALDGDTADRLLSGRVEPADAPPGYAEVATVLKAAAGPPSPGELAGESSAVATFVAMTGPRAGSRRRATGRRRAYGSRLAVLSAAALGVLLVGGVAAATTGTLPESARRMVDSVTRAAHHLPARSAVDRQDQGEVRSSDVGQDGVAVVGRPGASQDADDDRPAPVAPTGPGATGSARDGTCAQPLAGRGGVNACKKVKPAQQGHEPGQQEQGSQGVTHGGSQRAAPPASSTPASKKATDNRQKEGGPPGPEEVRR